VVKIPLAALTNHLSIDHLEHGKLSQLHADNKHEIMDSCGIPNVVYGGNPALVISNDRIQK